MSERIKDLLGEEIEAEILSLSALQPGSKEKTAAIEDLAKLYKLRIDETKNELDFNEKAEHSERDDQLRKKQLSQQVKEQCLRLGVEASSIILPLIFYAFWMKRGFKFEENGTYTSTTFRGLFNRFRPTK